MKTKIEQIEECEHIEKSIKEIKKALELCVENNSEYLHKKKRADLKYKILMLFKFLKPLYKDQFTDYDKEIFNIWYDLSMEALTEHTNNMIHENIYLLVYYERYLETGLPYKKEET